MLKPNSSMMDRLVHCPGSWRLGLGISKEEIDNPEVNKGITAHWLAATILRGFNRISDLEGTSPINDQVIDAEMIGHVYMYVNYIKSYCKHGEIERKLDNKMLTATPNCLEYDKSKKKITIIELKYGFSFVDVFENWQLLSYFFSWFLNNVDSPVEAVEFVIIQPRSYHPDGGVRKWNIPVDRLLMKYYSTFVATLTNIHLKDTQTSSGVHCRYCPVLLSCRTNLEACLNVINVTGTQRIYEIESDNWTLSKHLEMFQNAQEILKQRVNVLQVMCESKLKKGEVIPGFKMLSSSGKRVWDIGSKKANEIGIPYEEPKRMSPRQAELAGYSREFIDDNTIMVPKLKLTRVNIEHVAGELFGPSKEL